MYTSDMQYCMVLCMYVHVRLFSAACVHVIETGMVGLTSDLRWQSCPLIGMCACVLQYVQLYMWHNTHCMSVCGFVTDYCSSLSPNDTLSLYSVGRLQ